MVSVSLTRPQSLAAQNTLDLFQAKQQPTRATTANTAPTVQAGSGKRSIFDAVKTIVDLIANKNPVGVSVARVQEGYWSGTIIRGSDQGDVVRYATGATTVDLDTGGGDDTIIFSSNFNTAHEIKSGDGNDTVAATGPQFGSVDGGSGNDAIGVAGDYVGLVYGQSGNDTIAVAAGIVSVVDGGEGNDTISVSADLVAGVSGGDGDDVISVSSDNRSVYAKGGDYGRIVPGEYRAVMIDGGRGNDKIKIDGEGLVFFQSGDGQDSYTINDRNEVQLYSPGIDAYMKDRDKALDLDKATISNENGKVVVTFPGRDDKLTFQSANGSELQVEILDDERLVITPVGTKTQSA